ncbi:MAG: hypothetical protein KDB07_08145, partial [Planctomycetes bacterium]|nr:hypothetical protein [Planctomycetota bacterium]
HPAGEEVLLRELGKVAQRMAHEEPILYSGFQKTAEGHVRGRPDTSHPLYVAYDDMLLVQEKLGFMQRVLDVAVAEAEFVAQAETRALREAR